MTIDANVVLVAVTGLLGSMVTAVASVVVILLKSNQVRIEVANQRTVLDETHKAVNSNFDSLRQDLIKSQGKTEAALKQLAEAQSKLAASEVEKMIQAAVNTALANRRIEP